MHAAAGKMTSALEKSSFEKYPPAGTRSEKSLGSADEIVLRTLTSEQCRAIVLPHRPLGLQQDRSKRLVLRRSA